MDIAILAFTVLGALFCGITVLPLLGLDIRIFGRSEMASEVRVGKRGQKRPWLTIAVLVVDLFLSMGAFYYFFRPRIVEKTVDRVIEKIIKTECPKTTPPSTRVSEPSRETEQNRTGNVVVNGGLKADPCSSVQVGGIGNTSSVDCTPPSRELNPNHLKAFRDELDGTAGSVVFIAAGTNDDIEPLSQQLSATLNALNTAHWNSASWGYNTMNGFEGLAVLGIECYSDGWELEPNKSLKKAMSAAGLDCKYISHKFWYQSPHSFGPVSPVIPTVVLIGRPKRP
jgi:hypothetical protein